MCNGELDFILNIYVHCTWFRLSTIIPFCCCCSVSQSCLTLWNPMDCSTPGFFLLHHLPELAQTHVHWLGDAIQPSHPLSSRSPPAFNLSQHQGLFQWVAVRNWWPKYWSFSFRFSPSSEFSGFISFRIDWFDLLVVQGTLICEIPQNLALVWTSPSFSSYSITNSLPSLYYLLPLPTMFFL